MQTPAAPKKEPSSTLIYVSNLPFNARDEQLRGLFKEFDVKTAYVAVRRNGRSKGFGFVNLSNPADQQKAISAVDGKEFEGRKLTAKIAYNDDRRNEKGELLEEYKKALPTRNEGPPSETVVYISNLPWSYKDEDLKKLFPELNVKNANVAVRRNGKSKGFGFVEFETKEDQQKALQHDQKKIDDRVIIVKASMNYRGANQQPKPEDSNNRRPRREGARREGGRREGGRREGGRREGGGRSNSRQRTEGGQRTEARSGSAGGRNVTVQRPRQQAENTLYISNLPFDLEDGDLKSIFSEFNLKNAHVATRGASGRSLGFGFVEFNNAQDQKNALDALDQSEVNGRVITIKIANGSSSRREGGRREGGRREGGRREGGRREGGRREPRTSEKREPSSTLIYVSNLPFSVDDNGLSKIFAGHKINKAYVAVRKNGRSKGFGFVDLASHEEQQKALKLNGQEYEGRPLTVQVANKVEEKTPEAKN